jgi:hypothetical protein
MQRILAPLSVILLLTFSATAQKRQRHPQIAPATLLRIVRAEDERRWDGELRLLLTDSNAAVRGRAALASGRIGNEGALAELSHMAEKDKDQNVRALAVFAIGEVESVKGVNVLVAVLKSTTETNGKLQPQKDAAN